MPGLGTQTGAAAGVEADVLLRSAKNSSKRIPSGLPASGLEIRPCIVDRLMRAPKSSNLIIACPPRTFEPTPAKDVLPLPGCAQVAHRERTEPFGARRRSPDAPHFLGFVGSAMNDPAEALGSPTTQGWARSLTAAPRQRPGTESVSLRVRGNASQHVQQTPRATICLSLARSIPLAKPHCAARSSRGFNPTSNRNNGAGLVKP